MTDSCGNTWNILAGPACHVGRQRPDSRSLSQSGFEHTLNSYAKQLPRNGRSIKDRCPKRPKSPQQTAAPVTGRAPCAPSHGVEAQQWSTLHSSGQHLAPVEPVEHAQRSLHRQLSTACTGAVRATTQRAERPTPSGRASQHTLQSKG